MLALFAAPSAGAPVPAPFTEPPCAAASATRSTFSALGIVIWAPSLTGCARLIRSFTAPFVNPPAAATASMTRAPGDSVTTDGSLTSPITWTVSTPASSAEAVPPPAEPAPAPPTSPEDVADPDTP